MMEPLMIVTRKVLYKNAKDQSAKVSIPRWWAKDTDYVMLEVYNDKIIIRKVEGRA